MKTYIVCKQNENGVGVIFECSKCGKHLFVNSLCKRKECARCGRIFKDKIKVIKYDINKKI